MNKNDLLKDPLFQLNSVIWMLQPAAPDASWRPLLKNLGYSTYAISQSLRFPPDVKRRVVEWLGHSDSPCADVLAEPTTDRQWLAFECKANSFSTASTTSIQLKKYLIALSEIGSALALNNADAHTAELVYVFPEGKSTAFVTTAATAAAEVEAQGFKSTHISTIELGAKSDGITIKFGGSTGYSKLVAFTKPQVYLACDDGMDPRPMYYVPWDPEADKNTEFSRQGKQQLIQRCIIAAVSTIQRSRHTGSVNLDPVELIATVTSNLSRRWRSHSAIHQICNVVRETISRRLKRSRKSPVTFSDNGTVISIRTPDRDTRNRVCDILLRGDTDEKEDPMVELQQSLFDYTPDED